MAKKAVARIKQFDVIFEKDESGYVVASVPALPGCHTQGRTTSEAERMVKEAIELYLEVLSERSQRKRQLPKFIGIRKIAVPLPT